MKVVCQILNSLINNVTVSNKLKHMDIFTSGSMMSRSLSDIDDGFDDPVYCC